MSTKGQSPEPEEAREARVAPAPVPSAPQPPASTESFGAGFLRMGLAFYGVVALFAFGYSLFSGGLTTLLGEAVPGVEGLLGGLALGLALVLLSRVADRAWPPMHRMTDTLVEWIGPIDVKSALLFALVSGVAEELLFRGALWPHLRLLGTTLLFGLVHFLPRRSLWVYPLFATLAGLLLGLLREGTHSIWPPVLAHVTLNGFNLVWIGMRARKAAEAAAAAAAVAAEAAVPEPAVHEPAVTDARAPGTGTATPEATAPEATAPEATPPEATAPETQAPEAETPEA